MSNVLYRYDGKLYTSPTHEPNTLYVSRDFESARIASAKTCRLLRNGWTVYQSARGYALFERPKRVAYRIKQEEKARAAISG